MSQISNQPLPATTQPKWLTITGWGITVLVVLGLFVSAGFKLSVPLKLGDYQKMEEEFNKGGFSAKAMEIIGIVEIACALIYLFPRTAVLGAALLNGYLGGAICAHVVQKQPIWAPLIFGVVMWLGIYLREPRLRAIMPWRT
ncbi:DoxX family protein [Anatilimnocola sp. NA78]|uniref:DoxX family protein n=1 Tax=Anatilimnocola sp. NA78 TaxID=3415683 RepID=UPI003CE4A2E1